MADSIIVFAPFSNALVRDWPAGHYRRLIELCLRRGDVRALVVGAASQDELANAIVRGLPSPAVQNLCGAISWNELGELVDRSALVVANNSGVAHLGAEWGARTICIFGGSHSVYEWMPRGSRVVVINKRVACSPCAIDGHSGCPYERRCLVQISPEEVFAEMTKNLPVPRADASAPNFCGLTLRPMIERGAMKPKWT
jgi:ADP-heptose:LPS heptosyltransferase